MNEKTKRKESKIKLAENWPRRLATAGPGHRQFSAKNTLPVHVSWYFFFLCSGPFNDDEDSSREPLPRRYHRKICAGSSFFRHFIG